MRTRNLLAVTAALMTFGCESAHEAKTPRFAVDCAADPASVKHIGRVASETSSIIIVDGLDENQIAVYGGAYGLPIPKRFNGGNVVDTVRGAALIAGAFTENGIFEQPTQAATLACEASEAWQASDAGRTGGKHHPGVILGS